jgi:hypothetical protein
MAVNASTELPGGLAAAAARDASSQAGGRERWWRFSCSFCFDHQQQTQAVPETIWPSSSPLKGAIAGK